MQVTARHLTQVQLRVSLNSPSLASNVYWTVEGLASLASETKMCGTIIADNAAIVLTTNDTIEGRALTTAGAITISGVLAYMPGVSGAPLFQDPVAPNPGSTKCYALFTTNRPVSNLGVSSVMGDVGTNVGLTSGFDALLVSSAIYDIADGSTAQCAADLLVMYVSLNTLLVDIELLYHAQFGQSLALTPYTYLLNAATALTDSLSLNAMGHANAVFVINISGALSTSTHAKVILINGTQ